MTRTPARRGRPPNPDRPYSGLRSLREQKKLTLEEVADAIGTSRSNVHKYETQPNTLDWGWSRRFAAFYGVDPARMMFGGEDPLIAVVGYVGGGSAIYPIDDHPPGEGIDKVPCPSGLNPDRTVAVIVRGDSMAPVLPDGWMIFYSRDPESDAAAVLGKLCVVKVLDGATLVKQVRRGPTPGKFNLVSANAPMIEDAALEWASPVLAMMPPD